MSIYTRTLRPWMFRLNPEAAHGAGMAAIKLGLFTPTPGFDEGLETECFGLKMRNPVGLAAGFDKNGTALNQWEKYGFGFIELGTVTRHAQPGNPRPRLFRFPEQEALINRMGFNNDGADALARRLEKRTTKIPVGLNLGKSKVTELLDAPNDYAYSLQVLRDFGDYFVVNVSSPNTPGLRDLQSREPLTRILWRLREVDTVKPLFVKVSPDLGEEELAEIISVGLDFNITGLIATNTTVSRATMPEGTGIEGGLSGVPVRSLANQMLNHLKSQVGNKMVLIGVGGISDSSSAQAKLDLGASLVQIYTGWVYGGPEFVADICRGLSRLQP